MVVSILCGYEAFRGVHQGASRDHGPQNPGELPRWPSAQGPSQHGSRAMPISPARASRPSIPSMACSRRSPTRMSPDDRPAARADGQLLPYCVEAEVTHNHVVHEADTHFPDLSADLVGASRSLHRPWSSRPVRAMKARVRVRDLPADCELAASRSSASTRSMTRASRHTRGSPSGSSGASSSPRRASSSPRAAR